MKEKQNSIFDLIWIIPEIIGELFITAYIPVMLVKELSIVGALSITGMLYIAVIFLLLTNMRLTGLHELSKIKWRKLT
jgi:hypothetical protein